VRHQRYHGRRFVAGAAAIGTAAAFAGTAAYAQQRALIDTHHHFYPPEYQKLWLDWEERRRIPHFPGQVAWSRSRAIEDMDEAGIRAGILSIAISAPLRRAGWRESAMILRPI
jgi:6-methylsalicylate decarboxylase